jgi:hypothetical protein
MARKEPYDRWFQIKDMNDAFLYHIFEDRQSVKDVLEKIAHGDKDFKDVLFIQSWSRDRKTGSWTDEEQTETLTAKPIDQMTEQEIIEAFDWWMFPSHDGETPSNIATVDSVTFVDPDPSLLRLS